MFSLHVETGRTYMATGVLTLSITTGWFVRTSSNSADMALRSQLGAPWKLLWQEKSVMEARMEDTEMEAEAEGGRVAQA